MAGAAVRHILLPGAWRHLDVSAHGSRFHVAAGVHFGPTRPLVLLLHGFAQHWWAWRHQIPALDAAGYAVAALDLRGCGASDQTPHGYDPAGTAADVSGVVRSLGFSDAVLVGHDLGARAAWATSAYAPDQVRALVSVAAPHPVDRRYRLRPFRLGWLPVLPERRIAADDARWVTAYLRRLCAHPDAISAEELAPYAAALRAWPGPRCALAPVRLAGRGLARLAPGTSVPVLAVRGDRDPVLPEAALEAIRRHARGSFDAVTLPRVGHLPAEEDPGAFTRVLLDWLADPASVGWPGERSCLD